MQFEDEPSQYGENETGQPAKVGRPRGSTKLRPDEETIKQISGLARIQCTQREAAAVLGVHADTFRDFLHAHEKALKAWEDGGETGKASLRRHQFKSAESGNATMQIWLGKNWLAQTDKLEHAHTISRELVQMTDEELIALAASDRPRSETEEGEGTSDPVC
jgi:hypothetical protein